MKPCLGKRETNTSIWADEDAERSVWEYAVPYRDFPE